MTLAVIPARGGSLRIPRKNLQVIQGKSLIRLAIEFAQGMRFTAVVTTDDPETAVDAEAAGAQVIMSDRHTGCSWGSRDVWQEAWDIYGHETSVLLEPTSPMRTVQDVLRCLSYAPAATVQRVKTTNGPHAQYNGACYAAKGSVPESLSEFYPVLTEWRINIDDQKDLDIARCLIGP